MDAQVEVLLKDQVNKEFYSAYLYLAFSNYYHGENLDGFGHWFEAQAREEQEHAMKILKYLQDNGVKVELEAIAAPGVNFTDHREPLVAALKHEQYVMPCTSRRAKATTSAPASFWNGLWPNRAKRKRAPATSSPSSICWAVMPKVCIC